MIFTWSYLAFYDIPGPGKYGFLRSDSEHKKAKDKQKSDCMFLSYHVGVSE